MIRPINNILFSTKYPDDRDLITEAIAYAKEIPGAPLKTSLRMLLLRILPEETTKLKCEKNQRQAQMALNSKQSIVA